MTGQDQLLRGGATAATAWMTYDQEDARHVDGLQHTAR